MVSGKLSSVLSDQPEAATGRIKFADLERLIILAVHRGSKPGLNSMEPAESEDSGEFEFAGKLYTNWTLISE